MSREDDDTNSVRVGPTPQEAARYLYEKYWQNAPQYGVRFGSSVDTPEWLDTPRANRELLIDTFRSVLLWMRTGRR